MTMRVLITAGPTREYFDSVRFISNPSTGKMGYAIAAESARRGHDTILISGPVHLAIPLGVTAISVTSARQMFEACLQHFETCDAAIMTAAVCDHRPVQRLDRKLRKGDAPRMIELEPTEDICAHLGRTKRKQIVIGFAMEDHDHRAHAEEKLRAKHCDAIILNGIANVGADDAEIEVFHASGEWRGPFRGTKNEIALTIMKLTESLSEKNATES